LLRYEISIYKIEICGPVWAESPRLCIPHARELIFTLLLKRSRYSDPEYFVPTAGLNDF
jgi:hypothetical protein